MAIVRSETMPARRQERDETEYRQRATVVVMVSVFAVTTSADGVLNIRIRSPR